MWTNQFKLIHLIQTNAQVYWCGWKFNFKFQISRLKNWIKNNDKKLLNWEIDWIKNVIPKLVIEIGKNEIEKLLKSEK